MHDESTSMKTKIKKKEEGKKASRTSKCTYLVWDFKFTTGWLVKNRIYEAFVHNQSSQDNTGVLGSQSYARKKLHLLNPPIGPRANRPASKTRFYTMGHGIGRSIIARIPFSTAKR
jgi:hypothetical protein